MKCPMCSTVNRDDRTQCYHCNADLTLLRTVMLRAREFYNKGLEHAERGRVDEAIIELKVAISLYHDFPQAHNVLGTLYAKLNKFDLANQHWNTTLSLEPTNKRASDYLVKSNKIIEEPLILKQLKAARYIIASFAFIIVILMTWQLKLISLDLTLKHAELEFSKNQYINAYHLIHHVENNWFSNLYRREAISVKKSFDVSLLKLLNQTADYAKTEQYQAGFKQAHAYLEKGLPSEWTSAFNQMESRYADQLFTIAQSSAQSLYQQNKSYPEAQKEFYNLLSMATVRSDIYTRAIREMDGLKKLSLADRFKSLDKAIASNDLDTIRKLLPLLKNESMDANGKALLQKAVAFVGKADARKVFEQAREQYQLGKPDSGKKLLMQVDTTYLTPGDLNWIAVQSQPKKNNPKPTVKKK